MITQVFALPIRQGFVLLWGDSKDIFSGGQVRVTQV
jgi:hypothetical protein